MANPRILIVDDEEEILEMVSLFMEREHFEVRCLKESTHVLKTVKEQNPDLLILDILLPGLDGVELCRQIRTFSNIPILFISCKNEDVDKVIGLSVGGDDYITKPFSPVELVARVKAHLRRSRNYYQNLQTQEQALKFDELEIDVWTQSVRLKGANIPLSAREFKLLLQLAQHPGRIYTMDELFELVWGTDSFSDTRTIMVHISNLRKKLEEDPANPFYIQTVRGAGYRFNETFKPHL